MLLLLLLLLLSSPSLVGGAESSDASVAPDVVSSGFGLVAEVTLVSVPTKPVPLSSVPPAQPSGSASPAISKLWKRRSRRISRW